MALCFSGTGSLCLALVNDRVLDIRLWVYGLQHVEFFFFCGEDICLIMALDVIWNWFCIPLFSPELSSIFALFSYTELLFLFIFLNMKKS